MTGTRQREFLRIRSEQVLRGVRQEEWSVDLEVSPLQYGLRQTFQHVLKILYSGRSHCFILIHYNALAKW